jgi:hypothetical protein
LQRKQNIKRKSKRKSKYKNKQKVIETKKLNEKIAIMTQINTANKVLQIGDTVKFDNIEGTYVGMYIKNIANVLSKDGTKLYYVRIDKLKK